MRVLFALLAATLSLGLLPAIDLPALPAAVTLAAECATPALQVTLDPARSEPQAPHLTLHAHDLTLPASGHFEWGDGRFGIARLGGGAGSDTVEATISPTYEAAGDYTLSLQVTDACGAIHNVDYTVSVPLALPPPAQIPCPGMVDPSGVCVVGTGEETTLTIDGGPAGATWTWHAPAGTTAQDKRSHTFSPQPNRRYLVQASAPSDQGWIMTPVLRLIGLPAQRAAIADYEDPRWVVAGEPVQLGFTPPEQLAGAPARIELNGQVVAESTTATVHLEAGDHVVRYIVTATDGRQVQRQIVVVAEQDLSYLAPLAVVTGVIAGLGGLLLLMLGRLRWRRRLAVSRRIVPPLPAALSADHADTLIRDRLVEVGRAQHLGVSAEPAAQHPPVIAEREPAPGPLAPEPAAPAAAAVVARPLPRSAPASPVRRAPPKPLVAQRRFVAGLVALIMLVVVIVVGGSRGGNSR